mmetsp:Transcript_9157/g.14871  ORF Transcript_9157/g.14871 Transcript_9157/m.14871 type:complete len:540 (-) Transcript_9157:3546-5165(-)
MMEGVIFVSVDKLLLSAAPLLFVAFFSWRMNLSLSREILVSSVRTFMQLSIVGFVLVPIFAAGTKYWYVVFLYVAFMIFLASWESSSRPKYRFKGMFLCVVCSLFVNVFGVALFAFGVILRPTPLWDPQYVIPICGMLLGNCISGVSLSLNSLLTSYVEHSSEVELLLCFGATKYEASSRALREAVRSGTMPTLNTMAVIGLISIPGMMTGQVLGGTPPMLAARYQMLIMYLIATCSFLNILTMLHISLSVAFDKDDRLCLERLFGRKEPSSFWAWYNKPRGGYEAVGGKPPSCVVVDSPAEEEPNRVQLNVVYSSSFKKAYLQVRNVCRSVPSNGGTRVLFKDLTLELNPGEIVTVTGPSGAGKSQFLRLVAGLVPRSAGQLVLNGKSVSQFQSLPAWRKSVRYVPQSRINVPGTPREFIKRICSLKVNKSSLDRLELEDMTNMTQKYLSEWELLPGAIDKDWMMLSGGEVQRVNVAIALASRPQVLLFDESTSALDMSSKLKVEKSIHRYAETYSICVIWVSHDAEQLSRLETLGSP